MQLKSPAVAACLAAFLAPSTAPAYAPDRAGEVAVLRAQGPGALAQLLARYDRTPPGPERTELETMIDQVAAQRYATVARLYWYTDLDLARAAARGSNRPILALRMLGRLDEDLSCANSRLFRATLYANANVSRYLRDHFVLYWSSERPVPKVTIDFGDGRKLERTTTGNSAHYVLDADGNVLDVLPGLYAPTVFVDELGKSLAFAQRVRGLPANKLVAARAAYHEAAAQQRVDQFRKVGGTPYTPGQTLVATLREAQRATMSKMRIEVPDLHKIGMRVDAIDAGDLAQWAAIGLRMWRLAGNRNSWEPVPATLGLFDAQSLLLIQKLHGAPAAAVPVDQHSAPLRGAARPGEAGAFDPHSAPLRGAARPGEAGAFDDVVARLETSVIADTALNELQLRGEIRALLAGSKDLRFAPLNDWIYSAVFHTPKADAWLGLLPRTDFTGLPGDGVVMP